MNLTAEAGVALVRAVEKAAQKAGGVDVAVAPPQIMLASVAEASDVVRIYGQDVSEHDSGAYTGETSIAMLTEAGARGSLVGHSERRHVFGEDLSRTAAKVKQVVDNGSEVILCVGETLEQRKSGETVSTVEEQLLTALEGVDIDLVTIAYEPVWAIGTGETASPAQAQEVHAAIREWLREKFDAAADTRRLLYGGSVKPHNAEELLSQPDIDGVLVGGASLKADSFNKIIRVAGDLAD
jgi:triosephosphate isomerase